MTKEMIQLCWTAILLAFFGSLRLGELLSYEEIGKNDDILCWDDVKFREDESVLLRIKTPKTKVKQGEYIDIFEFNLKGFCPVKNLKLLKKLYFNNKKDPVFSFKNGKNLTPRVLI